MILDRLLNDETESRILPFLWMKGESRELIADELERIRECGIREVCVESRPYPEFCREPWWQDMGFLLEKARELGMRVWILDDRKFPTGFANGGYERQPEKSKIYLAERHMDIMGPCKEGAVLIQNFLGDDGQLLAVLACPKPDTDTLDIVSEGAIDLTDRISNGFVYFDLPEGAYRLFVLFTTRKYGGRENYMNLIDADSVRVLIDEVYETHYARFEEYFGNTIAGFFSDEPELGNVKGYPFDVKIGSANIRLPWSTALESRLRSRWGSDFRINLPSLWYGAGDETPSNRLAYMGEMTELVYECFTKQVGDWCRARGVEYIGHIIEDDNAHTRMGCSIGHYFREMRGRDMAGVDVVHHQIVPGFTGRVHQWIAGDADGEFFHFELAKLASSEAHIDSKKQGRALVELFGNYGWAEGVSLMRWLTNHMLVRGVNVFTPHAFSMTFPDRDCPPHFYARGNNPQYRAFGQLMRYTQRCATLLSAGKPVADAAVLYNAEAEWNGGICQLSQKPIRALMEAQLDCDVIPAFELKTAKVEGSMLAIGDMRYPCLVLPESELMPAGANAFAAAGLPVFCVGRVPELDLDRKPIRADSRIVSVSLSELAGAVRAAIKPILLSEPADPDLRFIMRETGDGPVCMFFNENVTRTISAAVRFAYPCTGVTRYDPWQNISRDEELTGGLLMLELLPGEAAFFILRNEADMPVAYTKTAETCIQSKWHITAKEYPGEHAFEDLADIEACSALPNMNGLTGNPGFAGIYAYEGSFEVNKAADTVYRLKLPAGGDTAEVIINGSSAGYIAGCPGSLDVTELLNDGKNDIRIEFSTTLVWKLKDGASTHLQVGQTGMTEPPVLEEYRRN